MLKEKLALVNDRPCISVTKNASNDADSEQGSVQAGDQVYTANSGVLADREGFGNLISRSCAAGKRRAIAAVSLSEAQDNDRTTSGDCDVLLTFIRISCGGCRYGSAGLQPPRRFTVRFPDLRVQRID
jgi:hypothetical protein